MAKLMTRLRALERAADTRALAALQVMPFVDDGAAARAVLSPRRGGADSYLGRDKRGRWVERYIVPRRADLVAARYADWIAARDAAKHCRAA